MKKIIATIAGGFVTGVATVFQSNSNASTRAILIGGILGVVLGQGALHTSAPKDDKKKQESLNIT